MPNIPGILYLLAATKKLKIKHISLQYWKQKNNVFILWEIVAGITSGVLTNMIKPVRQQNKFREFKKILRCTEQLIMDTIHARIC